MGEDVERSRWPVVGASERPASKRHHSLVAPWGLNLKGHEGDDLGYSETREVRFNIPTTRAPCVLLAILPIVFRNQKRNGLTPARPGANETIKRRFI